MLKDHSNFGSRGMLTLIRRNSEREVKQIGGVREVDFHSLGQLQLGYIFASRERMQYKHKVNVRKGWQ